VLRSNASPSEIRKRVRTNRFCPSSRRSAVFFSRFFRIYTSRKRRTVFVISLRCLRSYSDVGCFVLPVNAFSRRRSAWTLGTKSNVLCMRFIVLCRLLYSKYPEANEGGYKSSVVRESRYRQLTADKEAVDMQDMLRILGNRDDDLWPIFSDKSSARVSTINLGERHHPQRFLFYYYFGFFSLRVTEITRVLSRNFATGRGDLFRRFRLAYFLDSRSFRGDD